MFELDVASAPVTYALLVLNLLISGYALIANYSILNDYSLNVHNTLKNKEYYRVISCGFFHTDPFHFAFNMITLYSFGIIMEKVFLGSFNFLLVYMGSMIISHLITLFAHRFNSDYTAVGASGAISGILFSFCLFAPFHPLYILFIPIGIPAIIFALIYVAYSMYAMDNMNDRIAHEAHLGGAFGGVLLTILLKPIALSIFYGQIT